MRFRIYLIIRITILSLACFTLLVRLNGKCRAVIAGNGAVPELCLQVVQANFRTDHLLRPPTVLLLRVHQTISDDQWPLLHLHEHPRPAKPSIQPLHRVHLQWHHRDEHARLNAIAVRVLDICKGTVLASARF